MQSDLKDRGRQYQICCPGLPLAVYREIAAHLRQVKGVEVELIPVESGQFDYQQSQIGSLSIQYPKMTHSLVKERVEQILAYYGDRYGTWEELNS